MPYDRFSGPMVTTPPTQPRHDYAASLLPKLQHSRLSLTGVAAFGRDVYHADYQALVKYLPLEFAGEKFHNKLLMCKLHITPIHKRHQLLHRFPFTVHGRWPAKLILPMAVSRRLADAT